MGLQRMNDKRLGRVCVSSELGTWGSGRLSAGSCRLQIQRTVASSFLVSPSPAGRGSRSGPLLALAVMDFRVFGIRSSGVNAAIPGTDDIPAVLVVINAPPNGNSEKSARRLQL